MQPEFISALESRNHPHAENCKPTGRDSQKVMKYGAIGIWHVLMHVHPKKILLLLFY
jgi:hypothetical protein